MCDMKRQETACVCFMMILILLMILIISLLFLMFVIALLYVKEEEKSSNLNRHMNKKHFMENGVEVLGYKKDILE